MREKILCVVTTPLQLICVVEYLNYLNSEKEVTLLILANGSKLMKIFDTANVKYRLFFTKIDCIDIRSFNPRKNILRSISNTIHTKIEINKYLENLGNSSTSLILGHTPPHEIGYIAKKIEVKTVIVDDGIRTLNYLRDEKFRYKEIKSSSKFLSADWLIKKLYGTNGKYLEKSIYFTAFYEEADKENVKCIKNNFSFLKKSLVNKKKEEVYHFLGQPLIESKILSKNQYLNIILELKKRYADKFYYFPHPAENTDFLEVLIENKINIKKINTSYEEYIISSKYTPKSIGSFYSSAIYILSKLNLELNLYYIDISDFVEKKETRNIIKKLFKNLNESISIIEVS